MSPAPADFRDKLLAGLGGPWPESCALEPKILKREQRDGYRLEWVTYAVESDDRVPAILLVPDDVNQDRKAAGIGLWHQHAGQYHLGKSEPAGLAGAKMHHTGAALAREGYVVLCPDALGFEERTPGRLRGGSLERFLFLQYVVAGKSLAWKNILDMRRAVDYLASRPEVDEHRLGCYGHSMGSTHTWLVGPWEPRLKALVGNCCLPTYRGIHRQQLLHCFPNFVPGLNAYGDTPDIAALVAPRALHLNFGDKDGGTPIEDVPWSVEIIQKAYQSQHAERNFSYFIEKDTGHVLSDAMWQHTKDVFARHLAKPT